MIPDLRAIVPAGGAGTRLWPLSRAGSPKFLHDLTGTGRTLLQATVDRLLPLTGPEGVVVVTGQRHGAAVLDQLDLPESAILTEPSPRDSMAAIGLAAAVLLEREGPDVIVGSFAADHVIQGAGFADAVAEAAEAARAGFVAAVGVTATEPSTAFGYVRAGDLLGLPATPHARRVPAFTEKPDAVTAAGYLATGDYLWNASMYVFGAQVLLDHLARLRPALHEGLRAIAAAWDTPDRAAVLDRLWGGLESIAIDHAIAEPLAAEGGMAVVPGVFDWHDIGDFASLADELPAGDSGARVLGAEDVLTIDADGALVVTGGRLVAVLGIDDVVVVDTPDALLVTTRGHAQQIKAVVDAVRERRADLL